jgi:Cytochrome C'
MRRPTARTLLVAAALAAGLAWLGHAGAADAPTDAEFNTLLDQDVKIIGKAADAVEKAPTPKDRKVIAKNAGSGMKSSALILAGYANARITGTDPAADAKAAAVRDQAIKIYKAAADGNFKEAADLARGLSEAKGSGKAEKIDLSKAFGEVTSKDVMHNFLKTNQYGTNVEADIIANATKKGTPARPADTVLMAHRVLVMGEYSKTVIKAEGADDKKKWLEYNDQMMQATEKLLAAAKKKASPADMAKAFTAVNATCTACHDDFK